MTQQSSPSEGVRQQPAVPETRVDATQPTQQVETQEQKLARAKREQELARARADEAAKQEQLKLREQLPQDPRKPSNSPSSAVNPEQKDEEEIEQGGFAGAINKFMKGVERAQEAIQSVGAAVLENLAKILKMLGMEKWAQAILDYVAGADMAHLKDALDANGIKLTDPRTAEEPDPAAVKTFLADRKALFDSFGAVSKYTRKQYYAAVVKAWKEKAENQGKNEATPAELLAIARADVPKENPTPTPEPKKVEKPEDYPAFESLTSVDLKAGMQKVNLDGKIVGIRILPTGTIEISPKDSAVISRKIVPDSSPVGATMNITSASCASGKLSISYEQRYQKDGKTETAVDSTVLEAANFKQLVQSLVGGTQGTVTMAGVRFES
ncbi:MAG: hypothetical protein PHS73_04535 [Candidatus Peribacteraceae bacterium]|nr:hypothetical protein [Candidatus Peribacteraceae bacterium]